MACATAVGAPRPDRRRAALGKRRELYLLELAGLPLVDRHEAHARAGLELAELPELGGHDRARANEAAQAGTVGPEQDRHVAREIDGADGVGVVVQV